MFIVIRPESGIQNQSMTEEFLGQDKDITRCVRNDPVLLKRITDFLPIKNLPMTMEGMAAEKHPKAAMKERVLATLTFLADKTLWKYACHGIPPKISMIA